MKCVNFNPFSTRNLIKSGTRMQIFAQLDAPRAETDPHRLIPFLFFPLLRCLNVLQYRRLWLGMHSQLYANSTVN